MKKILAVVAVAALTLGTLSSAEARIGSSSSSSSSRSVSVSSSSSSRSMSSHIGGSMGVQRPVAMAAATSQSQAVRQYGNVNANSSAARTVTSSVTTSTTTTARSGGYYNSRPGYYGGAPVYVRPGYSGGTVAAAAVGGAVLGAAMAPHTTIINNGAPVYGNGAVYGNGGAVYSGGMAPGMAMAAAPVVVVHRQNGFLTFLEVIFGIVVVVGLILFLIRLFDNQSGDAIYSEPVEDFSRTTTRTTTTTSTTVDPQEERAINKGKQLLASAGQFYRGLQDANNRGDKARLRAMLTDDMYPVIAGAIDERDGQPGTTTVRSLRVVGDEVLALRSEGDVYYGSIHFEGSVNEGGASDEAFNEVWHFTSAGVNGAWKLEGIQEFGQ